MELIENRDIPGVYEIRLAPRRDERGFFMRVYDEGFFRKNGLHRLWVHENHSRSEKRGVIRGLHFQLPPFSETKLVRCVRGAVFDVFVDLRKRSPAFGRWGSTELSADQHNMVYIPRGFAHGFCTLTAEAEVIYKVDNVYAPDKECGLLWNDAQLAISWPAEHPILSGKDARNMTFDEFIRQHGGIDAWEQP